MDWEIFISKPEVIVALSTVSTAVFSSAINAFFNSRATKNMNRFAQENDTKKFDREIFRAGFEKTLQRYERGHVLLSNIARNYSLTSMTINSCAEMTPENWDKEYIKSLDHVDELRMIASCFGEDVSTPVEELPGQMNIYWGGFNNYLYRFEKEKEEEEKGEEIDKQANTNLRMEWHSKTNIASQEIWRLTNQAKDAMLHIVQDESRIYQH